MLAGWGPEQERKAKELLYRCMEELGSTKAALYLANTEGYFELAVSYGFGRRDPLLAQVKADHPLWDWIRRMRSNPTFINHPREAPQLHSFLEEAGTARLLTIPLLVLDRLVGFVDARDKGRRLPFEPQDVPVARNIAAGLVDFLYEVELYGSRPTEEKENPEPVAATPSRQTVPAPAPPHSNLHRETLEGTADLVSTLAQLPGLAAIALTVTDGKAVRTHVQRGSLLDHAQREALALHQIRCLEGAGVRVPDPASWGWSEEESGGDATADEIRSAILASGPPCWVVMSCLTPTGSPLGEVVTKIVAHQLSLLGQLRDYRRAARNLARVLLEPGESSFPHLRQHSQAVSELSQRMAAQLDLDERDEETLTIAAYLHDVGMRELEYQRVYRMERPGDVERRMFQRHPSLGARIVENSQYPGPLAGAILHHHERWDGKGYPQKLAGRTIPLFSRIIHLAEVYDVLTSSSSYRRPVVRDAAIELIRAEAGKQFDPDLVPVLDQVTRG